MPSSRANDGLATFYSFSLSSSVKFYEKTTTPPGLSGGGPIDTTGMHNQKYRTQEPKSLISLLPTKATVFYDPQVIDDIKAMVQVKQQCTVHWAKKGTYQIWGWIESFTPGETKEGEAPMAEFEFIQSGTNDSGVETDPVWTPAS